MSDRGYNSTYPQVDYSSTTYSHAQSAPSAISNGASGYSPSAAATTIDRTGGLRPYYSPGTFNSPIKVKEPSFSSYNRSTIVSAATSQSGHSPSAMGNSGVRYASTFVGPRTTSSTVSGRIPRTPANDFDFGDFGSTGEAISELIRSMLRLYGKIFISQPWRVSRLLLQVGDWSEVEERFSQMSNTGARSLTSSTGLNAPYDPYREGPLSDSEFNTSYGNVDMEEEEEEIEEEYQDSDDDLYGKHKPKQYAYRSSSSLSFRSGTSRPGNAFGDEELDEDEEELDDEMSYFTSVGGDLSTRKIRSSSPRKRVNRTVKKTTKKVHQSKPSVSKSVTGKKPRASPSPKDLESFKVYTSRIQPLSTKIIEILGAIYQVDSLKGLWRAINTSFILSALQTTVEAWLSGFFSVFSGAPDPHFIDVAFSPTPGASLLTAVAASVTTAVLLSPLSIVRTRLVTTTMNTGPRSIRTSLSELDSLTCPWSVLFPTIVYSGTTTMARKSIGYMTHVVLGVDKVLTPFVSLVGSMVVEVGVKLPLETIVRRSHMDHLTSYKSSDGRYPITPKSLIIKPVEYEGIFGTLWSVINGQKSVETLYRGWQVSLMGVISEWGLSTLDQIDVVSDGGKERF